MQGKGKTLHHSLQHMVYSRARLPADTVLQLVGEFVKLSHIDCPELAAAKIHLVHPGIEGLRQEDVDSGPGANLVAESFWLPILTKHMTQNAQLSRHMSCSHKHSSWPVSGSTSWSASRTSGIPEVAVRVQQSSAKFFGLLLPPLSVRWRTIMRSQSHDKIQGTLLARLERATPQLNPPSGCRPREIQPTHKTSKNCRQSTQSFFLESSEPKSEDLAWPHLYCCRTLVHQEQAFIRRGNHGHFIAQSGFALSHCPVDARSSMIKYVEKNK